MNLIEFRPAMKGTFRCPFCGRMNLKSMWKLLRLGELYDICTVCAKLIEGPRDHSTMIIREKP